MFGDGVLGEDAAPVIGKIQEQLVFFPGEVYGLIIDGNGFGLGVDQDLFELDEAVTTGASAALTAVT